MLILMLPVREALKIFTSISDMCFVCMSPIFNIGNRTWSRCLYHELSESFKPLSCWRLNQLISRPAKRLLKLGQAILSCRESSFLFATHLISTQLISPSKPCKQKPFLLIAYCQLLAHSIEQPIPSLNVSPNIPLNTWLVHLHGLFLKRESLDQHKRERKGSHLALTVPTGSIFLSSFYKSNLFRCCCCLSFSLIDCWLLIANHWR